MRTQEFVCCKTGFSSETTLLTAQAKDPGREYIETISFNYIWLGLSVIRKAIQQTPYYTFANLKEKFPRLTSITQFISDKNYLGGLKISINGRRDDVENLSASDRLRFARSVLKQIEPKGDGFLENDQWKEDFLKQVSEEYELNPVIENKDYRLIGLPFFNRSHRMAEFEEELNKLSELRAKQNTTK